MGRHYSVYKTETRKSLLSWSLHPNGIWCHSSKGCLCLEKRLLSLNSKKWNFQVELSHTEWGRTVCGQVGTTALNCDFCNSASELRLKHDLWSEEEDGYCFLGAQDHIHPFIHSSIYQIPLGMIYVIHGSVQDTISTLRAKFQVGRQIKMWVCSSACSVCYSGGVKGDMGAW